MDNKLINTEISKLIKQLENLGKLLESINITLEDMHLLFLKNKEKDKRNERPRR